MFLFSKVPHAFREDFFMATTLKSNLVPKSAKATWANGAWAITLACFVALAAPKLAVSQERAPTISDSAEVEDGEETTASASSNGSSLLRVMSDGGPLMWPIAGCSIVLLVFVFERIISLRRARVIPKPFVSRILEQVKDGNLGRDAGVKLCQEDGSPVAEVFGGALKKWGRPAVEVEQAVIDAGERVTHDLRKYLRLFNGISQVAPLLGLLGTVMGMITSFNTIVSQNAMGKAELLAGGIGEALLTTAGGLFVAIPALVAYLFFVSRVETLLVEIDGYAQQLVDMVSAEGMERESNSKTISTKRAKAA
jgi:biopolymer transport protein ExbB